MEKHDAIERKLCKELEEMEEKYQGGEELTETDLKRIDMIYHALKSKATYDAMKMSEYGHSGRYYSRDAGPGYSGHYPMMPRPYYEPERPW